MERFMPKTENIPKAGEQAFNEELIPKENIKNDAEKGQELKGNERFFQIPLTEEEKLMKQSELAKKLGISLNLAKHAKTKGYHTKWNPDYVFSKYSDRLVQERKDLAREYMKVSTPTQIKSLELVLGDDEVRKEIAQKVKDFKNLNLIASHYTPQEERMNKKFTLVNGDEVLIGDLTILNLFSHFNVSRDSNGKLQIFNPETNTYKPFTMSDITKYVKRSFFFNDVEIGKDKEKNIIKAYPTSMAYWRKLSPNAVRQGILRDEDFPIKPAKSGNYEIFGGHERKITYSKPQVYFSNENGSAQYYMGRDKFVGTTKKINHDTVSVLLLDNNTAGVVDNVHGKKEILYTFPLITKDEYNKKREVVVDKLKANNRDVSETNIASLVLVGGNEMKDRMKEYAITDYIKQKPGETSVQYAERISRLSDMSYALGQFREFMAEAGVGAQNFKWEEQLVLADAFTSVDKKQVIIDFARKFGEDGLRAFLSVEQGGKEMGSKIIKVGENLQEDVAEKVFAKYGELINTANDAQKILKEILPLEIVKEAEKEFVEIKESMLVRAKNLLITFHENKEGGEAELLKNLERYKAGMLLYADTFKKLKQEGKEIKLETIKNTELNILTQEEKGKIANELWDITIANRPFIKETEEIENRKNEFFKTIENKNSDFYVLKHGGSIVAFCSFTPDVNGNLYLESLNTESEAKGTMIGSEFLPSVLEKVQTLGKDIYGQVNAKNPGTLPYYERIGFEIKNVEENGELKYYEIRIPAEKFTRKAA